MCAPRSELATATWLKERSALGELLDFDFTSMPTIQLYRASDKLLKNKDLIEVEIFDRVQGIFNFAPTITLYDLTINYMEGDASINQKAKRGKKCNRVSAHYRLEITVDETKDHVTSLSWYYEPLKSSKQTDPGVLQATDEPHRLR